MDDEITFNHMKKREDFLAALFTGSLLPYEYTADDVRDAEERRKHLLTLKDDRQKVAVKKAANRQRHSVESALPCDAKVFLSNSGSTSLHVIQTHCNAKGISIVADPAEATVVLHDAPLVDVSISTYWALTLGGGVLCNSSYLLGQKFGSSVVFESALATKRHFWLSPDFLKQHPDLAAILRSLVAKRVPKKWREISTEHEFATHAIKNTTGPVGRSRPLDHIGFVTEADAKTMGDLPYLFTPKSFLAKFQHFSRASKLGAAGMWEVSCTINSVDVVDETVALISVSPSLLTWG